MLYVRHSINSDRVGQWFSGQETAAGWMQQLRQLAHLNPNCVAIEHSLLNMQSSHESHETIAMDERLNHQD